MDSDDSAGESEQIHQPGYQKILNSPVLAIPISLLHFPTSYTFWQESPVRIHHPTISTVWVPVSPEETSKPSESLEINSQKSLEESSEEDSEQSPLRQSSEVTISEELSEEESVQTPGDVEGAREEVDENTPGETTDLSPLEEIVFVTVQLNNKLLTFYI